MIDDFTPIEWPEETKARGKFFSIDPHQPVKKYKEAAYKILRCLYDYGKPITGLTYLSNDKKRFSASFSTKYNRMEKLTRKAILFKTTSGGKGSTWKLDDRSLMHMLKYGDKYGIEGAEGGKGTYHGHALVPLINYLISNTEFDLSIEIFRPKGK